MGVIMVKLDVVLVVLMLVKWSLLQSIKNNKFSAKVIALDESNNNGMIPNPQSDQLNGKLDNQRKNDTKSAQSFLSFNKLNDIDRLNYVARDKKTDSNVTEFNESDANNTEDYNEQYLNQIREFIFPKRWTWVLIILHILVFVIGIIGNILVCVAVYRNHTMRTVTNYFIVNLAVADFLVILFCLPPSVVWDVMLTWFFGVVMCKTVLYLQSVSVTVSVLTLTFISIDRWYAICFPLKFKSTTGRAKTAIGIIWIVALACDIPEAIYSTTVQQELLVETIYFTQCAPTWSNEMDTIFVSTKMILFYLIPLLFMSIAYIQIIRVLWKSGNAPHQMADMGTRQAFVMNMNTSTEGQLRSRRKAAKMLVAVVIMFAFCYFPVHLLSVLRLTVGLKNSETNRAFALISHWLFYANSAVNPIIYNFMSGKFRIEFRRAFEHCCQKGDRHSGFYAAIYRKHNEKDSGIASRSQSKTDMEMQHLNNFAVRHCRKGTKTSILEF